MKPDSMLMPGDDAWLSALADLYAKRDAAATPLARAYARLPILAFQRCAARRLWLDGVTSDDPAWRPEAQP